MPKATVAQRPQAEPNWGTFDELGRATVESATGGTSKSYSYSQRGELASVNHPSGTPLRFAYDDRGALIQSSGTAGNTIAAYDMLGRMTSRADGVGTATFGYTARC
jgi:YD repeat-containing protein